MALEDVLAALPELHGGEVEPLSGGLTNENYNTIAAAETGVGAPVVAVLREHDALVLEFLEGEVMDAEKLRRGDRLAAIASACRRLHGGRRFLHTFDMFQIQRR